MKAGCVFLVVFCVGVVDGFRSVLRSASRFAFRLVPSFASLLVSPFAPSRRFAFRSALRSALLFVSPFGRVGGRFVGRAVFVSSLGLAGVCIFCVLVSWRRCGGMSYR